MLYRRPEAIPSFGKFLWLTCLLIVGVRVSAAVEIADVGNSFGPFGHGGGISAWSPNEDLVMITEHDEQDARLWLCLYRTETGTKKRCPFYIDSSGGLSVYSLDWTKEYLHVDVGYNDGAAIYRVPSSEINKDLPKGQDIQDYNLLPQTYGYPAWDKWSDSLFFLGQDERHGIQVLGEREAEPRKYVSGAYPAATKRYVWFTVIDERTLTLRGIARVEKESLVTTILTKGYTDVFASPRSNEDGALFIRRGDSAYQSELFAYVEGKGVCGPLEVQKVSENQIMEHVSLSPKGKRALVTIKLPDPENELNELRMVRLVKLDW